MTDALARLLEGVIDYAGLFPPAKLSMAESVENYLRYRSDQDRGWILDRFVCTASRLSELAAALDPYDNILPVAVSVVGTSGDGWEDNLSADATSMTSFIGQAGNRADLEAYEIRIPDHENLQSYLFDLKAFNQVEVFCELPWGPSVADSIGLLAEAEWVGAKARTGGLDAFAFPSHEYLGTFLQQCVQLEVPFKLTAGLHHPIRSHRDEVGTKMHGFLNVLTAATMLSVHDLTQKETISILDSENPDDFVFNNSTLRFGEWAADVEDIADARNLFIGIGSCSVDEPLDDLRELKLI